MEENKERNFGCVVCQSLSKDINIVTTNYEFHYEGNDEDGYPIEEYNTNNTNFLEEYNQEHMTPIDLIYELKELATKQIDSYTTENMFSCNKTQIANNKKVINHLLYIIEECKGWFDDETNVFRDGE